ncbi:MAG: ABC transporter permease [Roseibium album]|uniref:ABC transporter permease n=1 Tax=Roseibium album TaxID=311410 RepID=UPI0032EE2E61
MIQTGLTRRLYLNPLIILGGLLFLLIALSSFQAQLFTRADPLATDLGAIRQAPSLKHLFGTDGVGRDVFARVTYGGRLSLQIAGIGMIGSLLVGSIAGSLAVFAPAPVRWTVERAIDIQLAFPYVLLAIAITSAVRPSTGVLILLMILAGWAAAARVVRSIALQERGKDYVKAAVVLGIPKLRIVLLHVFPTIWPSIVVLAAMQMAAMIVFEATLSFLGMGIQPPTPSWGGIMLDGKNYITTSWWLTTLPGLAIVLTSLSLILIGEGLQKRSLLLRSRESDT